MFNQVTIKEIGLIFYTQIAEYKQQPLLNIGFILSLAIATSTLLSILILNHASKEEYQQANALLSSPIVYNIVAKEGRTVSVADFAKLRKQGFVRLSPVLSFRKKLANGKEISIKAVDLLALSLSQPEQYDSNSMMLSESYTQSLAVTSDSLLVFENKTSIEKKISNNKGFGRVAILDITMAWQLFSDIDNFNYLIVGEISDVELARLNQVLPEHLVLQETWSLDERSGFADALHLNLMALAILGFVVSLFIAYQAANQAWYKRSALMAQLRLLGFSLTNIYFSLSIEAIFLILVASISGVIIALILVSFLLPILGLTLSQLYELKTSGHFYWNWQYLLWSLAISSAAVFLALLKQFFLISNQKISLFSRQIKTNVTDKVFFTKISSFSLLSLVAFFIWPETSWHHIMLKYGLLLLVGTAFLPLFLRIILSILGKLVHQFQLKFIVRDAVNQISLRFLPLAAFYIALTTSIAAALMVNSFESAFVRYLEQNLSENLYVFFKEGQKQDLIQWFKKNKNIEEYNLYYKGVVKAGGDTVTINTVNSIRQLESVVLKPDAKNLANISIFNELSGNGCLVNEPLALNRDISLNNTLNLSHNNYEFSCQVSGIYYDYGNPGFEITLGTDFAVTQLKSLTELGFGVYLKTAEKGVIQSVKQALMDELSIQDNQIYEPEVIKKLALTIFSQTFILTQAIAAALLSIACFGLFLSANNLELARKDDLLVLISLGYSRRSLFVHMFSQWFLLAGGSIILSWPIAILIANALVTKVFPSSFGWSMPLVLDVFSFSTSSLMGLLLLFPALIIPLRKITVKKGRGTG